MDMNLWGTKLKNLRTALNLTQADLGAMLKLSQVTIANYEQGKRFPKHQTLLDIAGIFDVSLDVLLNTPDHAGAASPFPREFRFEADRLISILLQEPLETALAYTASWKQEEKLGLADFYETVLVPVLIKTGTLWFQGDILISEEHLISDKVRELIFYHSNREGERGIDTSGASGRWMGFCAPGEKHELALLMQSHVLRQAGWQIVYLGTQVPFNDLLDMIKKYEPDVLGISITMEENVPGLELYITRIEKTFGGKPAIILGGQCSSRIALTRFSSVHTGASTFTDGLKLTNQILSST